jgi:hypothetical protein
MCYGYYNDDDDRPDDDWDDEMIQYFHDRWLFDKAMREYTEEDMAVMAPKAAPKAAHADLDAW